MSESEKPYLSPTRLDMICRCGEQYRRRYGEKEIIPPGIAAIKGTGLHRGAALNFKQKIASHRDLPETEIVNASVDAFDANIHGGFVLTPDEESAGVSRVIGRARDDVAQFARLHAAEVAPRYQPVYVEERVRIPLPGATHDLLGVIDMGDDRNRVVDHKTSGKRKNRSEVDTSIQLTVYAAGHRIITGSLPDEVRLEVMVKSKSDIGPSRQVLRGTRGPEDFQSLAHRVNAVVRTIESGAFMPAVPGSWYCSATWCGYWRTCRFVQHGGHTIHDLQPPPQPQPQPQPQNGQPVDEHPGDRPMLATPNGRPARHFKNRLERMLAASPACSMCGRVLTGKTAVIEKISATGSNEASNLRLKCRGECQPQAVSVSESVPNESETAP
jgi:hypothetical protein